MAAHRAVTVLVDPEPAHRVLVRIAEHVGGGVHDALHRPPRHPVSGGDLSDDPPRADDGVEHRGGQSGPDPRPGRDLVTDLGERAPQAEHLAAGEAALQHHDLDRTRDGHVPQPLPGPLVRPDGQRPAVRARRLRPSALDDDFPGPVRAVDRVDHAYPGRLGNSRQAPATASQPRSQLVILFWMVASTPPIPSEGHEPPITGRSR